MCVRIERSGNRGGEAQVVYIFWFCERRGIGTFRGISSSPRVLRDGGRRVRRDQRGKH